MSHAPIAASLLAVALTAGCEPAPTPLTLSFDVRYAGEKIGCGTGDPGIALTDLRLYVHDLTVGTDTDERLPVRLLADGRWQTETVALLDLEDGEGDCANGSPAVNRTVRGEVELPAGQSIDGIRFRIGVPASLNHANPMTATPPLSYTAMHWHWRSGYKFLRAGVHGDRGSAWLHLGSAQCTGVIGDIRGCAAANRPRVTIDGFDPSQATIIVDLAHLFDARLLGSGDAERCESGPDQPACAAMFHGLGIDSESGDAIADAALFHAEPR